MPPLVKLTLRPLIDAFPRQRLAFPDANPPIQYFHPYYMKCPPPIKLWQWTIFHLYPFVHVYPFGEELSDQKIGL